MQEVKNRKFRSLMADAGLEDVKLYKDDGFFFIASDSDKTAERIQNAESYDNESVFYINSFNQQAPEDWVHSIQQFFKKGEESISDEDFYKRFHHIGIKKEGMKLETNKLFENIYRESNTDSELKPVQVEIKPGTGFTLKVLMHEDFKCAIQLGDDNKKRNNGTFVYLDTLTADEVRKGLTFTEFLRAVNTERGEQWENNAYLCRVLDLVAPMIKKIGGEEFNLAFKYAMLESMKQN